MKWKKSAILVCFSFLLVGTSSFAQESNLRMNFQNRMKSRNIEELQKMDSPVFKKEEGTNSADFKIAKERFEELRQGLKERLEMRRKTARERMEKMKELMEKRKEEFREKLKEINDQRKREIVERISKRLNELNQRRAKVLEVLIERLEKLFSKIEIAIQKIEEAGRDVSSAKAKLEALKQDLAGFAEKVEEQKNKEYVIEIKDEENLGQTVGFAYQSLISDYKALHQEFINIRRKLKDVMVELKGERAVPTEAVTPEVTSSPSAEF